MRGFSILFKLDRPIRGIYMSKKCHTPEQIISKLKEVEVQLSQRQSVPAACKRIDVSEQTYCRWRKEWRGLRLDQPSATSNSLLSRHWTMPS
jgi:hypothetical protein